MNLMEAIRARHSVRAYTDRRLDEEVRSELQREIDQCNADGRLSIRLVCDEPQAFNSMLANYGKFSNVKNYLVLAGSPAPDLDERCGYFGEKLVLTAQQLGLNTCWVALTFKKRFVKKTLDPNTKLSLVIAIGYGDGEGKSRKSKSAAEVSHVPAGTTPPEWFTAGVEAALLAPTAVNQQKFLLTLTGDRDVTGKPLVDLSTPGGAYSAIDLGIVRLHFEIGAGAENFAWNQSLI